jgi:hypothetical protein
LEIHFYTLPFLRNYDDPVNPHFIYEINPDKYIVSKNNFVGSGSYGAYYQIDKERGIKICKGNELIYEAESCVEYIREEYELLQELFTDCPGVFPRPYGIVPVVLKGRIKCETQGILMEHIEGRQASHLRYYTEKWNYPPEIEAQITKLKNKLSKKGWRWFDDHSQNILVSDRGQVRFIDAGRGNSMEKHRLVAQIQPLEEAINEVTK